MAPSAPTRITLGNVCRGEEKEKGSMGFYHSENTDFSEYPCLRILEIIQQAFGYSVVPSRSTFSWPFHQWILPHVFLSTVVKTDTENSVQAPASVLCHYQAQRTLAQWPTRMQSFVVSVRTKQSILVFIRSHFNMQK